MITSVPWSSLLEWIWDSCGDHAAGREECGREDGEKHGERLRESAPGYFGYVRSMRVLPPWPGDSTNFYIHSGMPLVTMLAGTNTCIPHTSAIYVYIDTGRGEKVQRVPGML